MQSSLITGAQIVAANLKLARGCTIVSDANFDAIASLAHLTYLKVGMLEDIAYQYVNASDGDLSSIAYGLAIVGFIIAATITRGSGGLSRAPYFAYSSLLFLAGVASQFVWLSTFEAISGGFLWALVAVDIVSSLIIGYLAGIIALARSRDAFGHGRWSFLAFIPLANLVLLLKASENEMTAKRISTIPLVTGGVGVASGIVILVGAAVLAAMLEEETQRMAERASEDPLLQTAGIEAMIRAQGLEKALAQMASELTVPQQVDDVTTLFQVATDATTLRYLYTVNENTEFFTDSFEDRLTQNLCSNRTMRPVLQNGGIIEQAYFRLDGSEIGTVRIARDHCRF